MFTLFRARHGSVRRPSNIVVSLGLALLVLLTAMPPHSAGAADVKRDPRFGINQAWESPDAADTAGVGSSRVLLWWSELQKRGPDELDLFATDQDSFINSEKARGRELVGGVLNTPLWVSTDGTPNGVPRNLHYPWDHPDNYWGQFTYKLADHYKGRIDTWIIWNEVDIQHGQWNTWNGTMGDYVQLLRVAYRNIKAANPNARVLPFGGAWWYDRGDSLSRMLDIISTDPEAKKFNNYFDAANLHLYSRANDIPRIVGWYQDQLKNHGMEKPIWIGETNAVPYDDPIWPVSKSNFRASLDEQASYIVEAFATYIGLGVQRVSVQRMIDGEDLNAGGEPFGMIRNDGSSRPALAAFQVVTSYFGGATDAVYYPTEPSGLTRVVLKKPGELVSILWTMKPDAMDVTLESSAPRALRVSKDGQANVIQATNGQFKITLSGATANSNASEPRDYVVGGSPVILVERLDGNAQAAYRPIG